jgi:hypothetical protein
VRSLEDKREAGTDIEEVPEFDVAGVPPESEVWTLAIVVASTPKPSKRLIILVIWSLVRPAALTVGIKPAAPESDKTVAIETTVIETFLINLLMFIFNLVLR